MPKVKGTKGNWVTYEVRGIAEVKREIEEKRKGMLKGMALGVARAGELIEVEVKESVAGNRAEPKSVNTGAFLNNIKFEMIGETEGEVGTDLDYPVFLEYGTSKISPRGHFSNTKSRKEKDVQKIIGKEVELEVAS